METYKKSNLAIIIPTVFAVIVILTIFYWPNETYPDNVQDSLLLAGDNADELQTVLEHYQNDDDPLKLEAAYFLIGNMSGHSFVNYALLDTNKNEINFNVNDYENYDQLKIAFKELETKHGVLDFEKKDKFEDLTNIKSDFLIEHIDAAFEAWHSKPWSQNLSFNDFCEYVLPYRGSNEPLEEWRQTFVESYATINLQMTDTTDPIEAAALINTDIMSFFTFDSRYYYHPTDQSLTEMIENGFGRCEDMTNITIYAFRANALAVTSDYTPYWANTGNNHAWNAILTRDNKVIPFMGCEANPGEYKLNNIMAKAYRKMFSEQKENLYFQNRKQEKMPRWLAGKNYKDVTKDYVEVCNVSVTFEKEIPDSVDIAYLCVFNSGEWKPIHWGRIENSQTTFTDMGINIAYLPALYLNEEIVPYSDPFILQEDCSKVILKADKENFLKIDLNKTTEKKLIVSTDGIKKKILDQKKVYELHYWDDGWQLVGEKTALNKSLLFENVPANSLYWLLEKGSNKEERIFTYEDGQQVWW